MMNLLMIISQSSLGTMMASRNNLTLPLLKTIHQMKVQRYQTNLK